MPIKLYANVDECSGVSETKAVPTGAKGIWELEMTGKITSLMILLAGISICPLTDALAQNSPSAKTGTVNCSRLLVRVKPQTNSNTVATMKRGDRVTVLEEKNGYYRTALTSNAAVWLSERFISKDGRLLKDVNLRSGPGVSYRSFGLAKGGQTVQILERKKEWVRIKPLSEMFGWVSKQYVQLDQSGTASAAATSAEATAKPPVKKVEKTAEKTVKAEPPAVPDKAAEKTPEKVVPPTKPVEKETAPAAEKAPKTESEQPAEKEADTPEKTPEKAVEKTAEEDIPQKNASDPAANSGDKDQDPLPFIPEKPEEVVREGVLLSLNNGAILVTHALCVKESNGNYRAQAYLYGNGNELAAMLEKKVRIKGLLRWVKGWKIPVIKVSKIEELPSTRK